jgi:hypothetical protein
MKWIGMVVLAGFGIGVCAGQVVNPKDNPLLGTWVYSSGGIGKGTCSKKLIFEPHRQTIEFRGLMSPANATYAVEPGKVYVQEHAGPGATKAFVIISKGEIMDTMGYGACHWKRE